jgi:hypothetical protein
MFLKFFIQVYFEKKSHWIVQGKKQRKPIYIMDFHGEKPWFPVKMFPSTNPVMKFLGMDRHGSVDRCHGC